MSKNGSRPSLVNNSHPGQSALKGSFKSPAENLEPKSKNASFFIVGVGASAGGLEAFTELLRNIPADTNMAFVLVQHLAPSHESLLSELLSKATRLPVNEVVNNTVVLPGHVYVIPPNASMVIAGGILHLSGRKNITGRNTSIDVFFRSLADDQKEHSIGVVLSGSDSDGVLGLEKIKAEGGITFAQDEASAQFKDMPRKAAASGIVDFVLPPKGIAAQLSRLPGRFSSLYSKSPVRQELSSKDENTLSKILHLLKSRTGMDFAFYKPSTILRRVTRRMLLQRMSDLEDYLGHLRKDADEAQALRKDLLINVTSFFREPAGFDILKKKIFPDIMKRRPKDAPIRIWVPGCSTGNEAYSIAICLDEFLKNKAVSVQVFATDVSDAAVENARRGVYPENIKLDVSAARLERYFNKTDNGYQIKKSIRDVCIFATHNMVSDPPFSDIDLISCRNVLIYMEPQLQKKAVAFFHYSLKPSGFLMLGSSETVGELSDFFTSVDKRQKVYSKKKAFKKSSLLRFAVAGPREKPKAFADDGRMKAGKGPGFEARKEADRLLDGEAFKDGVLVTEGMEIIEFFGDAQPYIRPTPGHASFSLLRMASESLLPDLCIALYEAKKKKVRIKKERLPAGRSQFVDVEVIPFHAPASGEFYFLVLFKKPEKSAAGKRAGAGRLTRENARLKRELVLAKESLLAITREQESVAEEFRCQSEEIQSSNEEFQSTNEELETAKEELQSANEELTTVNNEMEMRNGELIHTNDDLNNLIMSVHIPIILVDGNLRIRRFTAKAEQKMGLVTTDIGRRLADIGMNLPIKTLEAFIHEVIDSLEPKEREVEDSHGCWYLMRVRPYRRQDGKIDGAVLMFIDIMDIKRSMMQLQDAKHYSETIVETLWEPLVALDTGLRIKSANKSFYDFFKVSKHETNGRLIYDLGNEQWNIPELKELLEELLTKNSSFYNFEMRHDFPKIGLKLMLLNAHKIALREGAKEEVIILAFQDITEQKHAEEALNKIAAELSFSNKELDLFASTAAHDLQSPLNRIHIFAERLLGEGVSEKGQSYLKAMIRSSNRMRNLVDNLLRVSRVTSHGHERERVPLEEVVKEVIYDLEIPIQESGAVIERAKLPTLAANRVQMHQLFQNLIGNSIKYRKKDEPPRVNITSRLTEDAVEVVVSDNGIGFDEKHTRDVFVPFKRLHGSSEYEGSGIGLALCQKIMRHHGGEIAAKSRPGEGSTFILTWPIKALSLSNDAKIEPKN